MEHSGGLNNMKPLWLKPARAFFAEEDVVLIARRMLGMKLVSKIGGKLTSGIITETEAYAGITDRASHAFGGKRTPRTEVMYGMEGIAYIYLCYGIHALFNVVTNHTDIPHAVLVRGIFPCDGINVMEERIKRAIIKPLKEGNGPGRVTRLLGIDCALNGVDLIENDILWLETCGMEFEESDIFVSHRIGVGYAGADALLPYRFIVNGITAMDRIKKQAGIEK